MPVIKSPFEAQHGYKSPGFTVDELGNVTVRTLSYTVQEEVEISGDFIMRQTGVGVWSAFTIDGYFVEGTTTLQENPGIALTRDQTYTFTLLLTQGGGDISFNLYYDNPSDPEGAKLSYDDGMAWANDAGTVETTEGDAQGQSTGKVTFSVPANAPATLYYADGDQTPIGTITVSDPTISGIGSFSTILTTGDMTAQGQDATITLAPTGTGTVVINPLGGGTLSNMDVNANALTSSGNVTLGGADSIIAIKPTGTGTVDIHPEGTGNIDNVIIGQTTAQNGAFLDITSASGTLNNTVIGNVTPATASFTTATASQNPTGATEVTNKKYVDMTASALAIALGV